MGARPKQVGVFFQAFALAIAMGLLGGLLGPGARAQPQPTVPPQREVCVGPQGRRIVDKELLARFLLRGNPINVGAVDERLAPALGAVSISRRVLATRGICADNPTCSPADRANLQAIAGVYGSMAAGSIAGYRASAALEADVWFSGPNEQAAIACVDGAGGQDLTPPGSQVSRSRTPTTALRIRGRVDELYVDRSSRADFLRTTPGTVSYTSAGTTGRDTATVNLVAGYSVNLSDFVNGLFPGYQAQELELIPYVTATRLVTRVRSGTQPAETSLFGAGVTATAYLGTPNGTLPIGHRIDLRPELLLNAEDESQIASANLRYMPVVNAALNDFRFVALGDHIAWYRLVLDARLNAGRYVSPGDSRKAGAYEDFLRLGGQVGFGIGSTVSEMPIDFLTTYTWMPDAVGRADVGYFSNKLTFSLDPYGYVGITLSYVNGTREDNAAREQIWSAGLSLRF